VEPKIRNASDVVGWAVDAPTSAVQDVGVDHGRADVLMSK